MHTASRGVVRTGLKHDNIFFDTHLSNSDIRELLVSDLPRRHPPESSHEGMVRAAVSHPLPTPTYRMLCVKLSSSQISVAVSADFAVILPVSYLLPIIKITPLPLRPPEIVIGGLWNKEVGMWTFGCLVRAVFLLHCCCVSDGHISQRYFEICYWPFFVQIRALPKMQARRAELSSIPNDFALLARTLVHISKMKYANLTIRNCRIRSEPW
jgi:hypothetical protein